MKKETEYAISFRGADDIGDTTSTEKILQNEINQLEDALTFTKVKEKLADDEIIINENEFNTPVMEWAAHWLNW